MKDKYNELLRAFPRLYRSLQYIQCNTGWYDLLYKLSEDIEASAQVDGIDRDSDQWPRASQVKEKFGSLRYYLRNGSAIVQKLIEEAQKASIRTCESCGQPGQLLTTLNRYVSVKCPACALAEAKAQKRPVALPDIYVPTQREVGIRVDGKDTKVIMTFHDFIDDKK